MEVRWWLGTIIVTLVNEVTGFKEALKIVAPARIFCCDPLSFVDQKLNVCVRIDRNVRRVPLFAECPNGTLLNGRSCVGLIRRDFEEACPHYFNLNEDEECIKATVYNPPNILCPEGFQLYRDTETKAQFCKKRSSVAPLYAVETSCGVWSLECPGGYKPVRRVKSAISNIKALLDVCSGSICDALLSGWSCESRIIVPPDSIGTCKSGFTWSDTTGGCLSIKAINPALQCPKPDPKAGFGRGDWDTPHYQLDESGECCLATWAPAIHPRCPPGWALEGLFNPYCYKKVFSSLQFDCKNLEGFSLSWDENSQTANCEFSYSGSRFAEGPNYLAKRAKINANYLRLGSSPWNVLQGYQTELQIEDNRKSKKNVEKKDEFESILNGLSDIEREEQLLAFDVEKFYSHHVKKSEDQLEEDLSLITFNTLHPRERDDLLGPREPGSTGLKFHAPRHHYFKLYHSDATYAQEP